MSLTEWGLSSAFSGGDRARPVTANLNHVDYVGGAVERAGTISRRFDGGRSPRSIVEFSALHAGSLEQKPLCS